MKNAKTILVRSRISGSVILSLGVAAFNVCATVQKDFLAAKKLNTASAYEDFLRKHPNSAFEKNAYLGIARSHTAARNWSEAEASYGRMSQRFPEDSLEYNRIRALLTTPAEPVVITNLGPTVNSRYEEYFPVITADEKTLYFCSNDMERLNTDSIAAVLKSLPQAERLTRALKIINDCPQEEIWRSDRGNESWAPPYKLRAPLNSQQNDAVEAISVDKTTAYIFRNGRIMISRLKADGEWEDPVDAGDQLNTGRWDADVSLSSDGRALLFSSNRKESIQAGPKDTTHSKDLYVSFREGEKWCKPINLGRTINTNRTERSPYLHSDGRTLYFSSDRHPGVGELDVCRSVRIGDSWTEWSEPENLGREINTAQDDWGYKIPAQGDRAYYSVRGRPDSFGGQDIYVIQLPSTVQPMLAVTAIYGKIIDRHGKPLDARVLWEYKRDSADVGNSIQAPKQSAHSSDSIAGEARSNPMTGEYFITLPAGRNYTYFASKDGYYPTSQNIDLRDKKEYQEYNVDIVLLRGDEEAIVLKNIFFDFNSTEILPASESELRRLYEYLTQNSGYDVEISGHTDDVGSDAYNLTLSHKRAKAVVAYLESRGIVSARMTAKGYGKQKPIDNTGTDEGRAKNRRVEFRLVK